MDLLEVLVTLVEEFNDFVEDVGAVGCIGVVFAGAKAFQFTELHGCYLYGGMSVRRYIRSKHLQIAAAEGLSFFVAATGRFRSEKLLESVRTLN